MNRTVSVEALEPMEVVTLSADHGGHGGRTVAERAFGDCELREVLLDANAVFPTHVHVHGSITLLLQGSYEELYASGHETAVCRAPSVVVKSPGRAHFERVGPEGAGVAVLEYLASHWPHSDAESWRARLGAGLVRIGGVAVPSDRKASALLQGRYQAADRAVQIVRPVSVMDELLATVLTVQKFVVAGAAILANLYSSAHNNDYLFVSVGSDITYNEYERHKNLGLEIPLRAETLGEGPW